MLERINVMVYCVVSKYIVDSKSWSLFLLALSIFIHTLNFYLLENPFCFECLKLKRDFESSLARSSEISFSTRSEFVLIFNTDFGDFTRNRVIIYPKINSSNNL